MYQQLAATGVPRTAAQFARRMMTAVFSPALSEEEATDFLRRLSAFPPIAVVFVDQPWVELARELLHPMGIGVGVEAAYPVGNTSTEAKIEAIREAIRRHAVEIDVGGHFAAIKSGDYTAVQDDARTMVDTAADAIRLMVLPEMAILIEDEKLRTLEAYAQAGVRGIKTCSGYGWNSQPEDVLLVRERFADTFQIDVSGGVRSYDDAMAYFEAKADKIHASPIFKILAEAEGRLA